MDEAVRTYDRIVESIDRSLIVRGRIISTVD
jgi:hypothetical protein